MGRVTSKKVSENNILIKIKIIKYKITMSTLLLITNITIKYNIIIIIIQTTNSVALVRLSVKVSANSCG
jgi:hypothetical protein